MAVSVRQTVRSPNPQPFILIVDVLLVELNTVLTLKLYLSKALTRRISTEEEIAKNGCDRIWRLLTLSNSRDKGFYRQCLMASITAGVSNSRMPSSSMTNNIL
jgi:hypothetical protein